jgi:hypothetical protein
LSSELQVVEVAVFQKNNFGAQRRGGGGGASVFDISCCEISCCESTSAGISDLDRFSGELFRLK